MSYDDSLNTITELEHFYTFRKNHKDDFHAPSSMVDKAWHQHILHTSMWRNFSRQHFDVDRLYHRPFWSGNKEDVKKEITNFDEYGPSTTDKALVSLFGSSSVNATVWLTDESEPNRPMKNINEHTEIWLPKQN